MMLIVLLGMTARSGVSGTAAADQGWGILFFTSPLPQDTFYGTTTTTDAELHSSVVSHEWQQVRPPRPTAPPHTCTHAHQQQKQQQPQRQQQQ